MVTQLQKAEGLQPFFKHLPTRRVVEISDIASLRLAHSPGQCIIFISNNKSADPETDLGKSVPSIVRESFARFVGGQVPIGK